MRTPSIIYHSLLALILAVAGFACSGTPNLLLPGQLPDGRVRLPNGWFLSPAGSHVQVGELPLNMAVTPDERYILLANNGTREQSISVIDGESWQVVQTVPLRKSWLGLRFIENGTRFLVSGGNDNRVYVYRFSDGRASLADSIVLGLPWPAQKIWVGGLDMDEATQRVFVAGKENDSLYVLDLRSRGIIQRLHLAAKPYTCLVSRTRSVVYVSLWGGSAVALFDRNTLQLLSTIRVGDHPCDMLESPDGKRLFVANANENTVSVIDLERHKVMETLSTALFPKAPAGSTPNALALSPDGATLYVANADNNYVAVMDVSVHGNAKPLGFIPVGWYPTGVKVLASRGQLLIANGKGEASRANPLGPNPEKRMSKSEEYIGSLFRGSLSQVDLPDQKQLADYTLQVYANSPYNDMRLHQPGTEKDNPVPWKVGEPSPIKFVFYVIKENRTYDQVFGDLKEGNGDERLCLFPDSVTPNHHALAREFVLLDNFYADAEVSADGHNWSMGAYATDYTEKIWPTSYGGRGGEYEFEGGYPIVYPSAGYLWDNCNRHGVSYRTYGEFVRNPEKTGDSATAAMPSLEGHVAPFYRGWDLEYSDVQRVREWMKEFEEFERRDTLPRFQIVKLPNDHTNGTRKGSLTPKAYVAQNDLALGMLVERISHSRFWKESAIFVIEDDAQNGPDHVDAHRTVALVISPYTKRHAVDSELYSTSSMVRTMELILGLPPLSQFDAAATPMYNSFTRQPDFTPYTSRPARINLDEKNIAGVYGQERSGEMNFSREDAIPDVELNEIVWRSIHGPDDEMPAPVRSAFVRVVGDEKEDEDD
ncbi:MAG TPA: bifunctional YncE family protein/alkaline phosphatase family protein [Bacteroidota bacterium]|nr:bifunctional YncE family protein/alkaline phosphatase family protein [Bacteroidota bacterium]